MSERVWRNALIALSLIIAMVVAVVMRPTYRMADHGELVVIEEMIPSQFGDWKVEQSKTAQIINPQIKETLDKIYTQTLSRTYVNNKNQRVMLSIAYGPDQSDVTALHYPEVCYPAQGFQVESIAQAKLDTDFGDIRIKRLVTSNNTRSEPLIYWTTVGDKVVRGAREAKLAQLQYGFQGIVPDGIVFRVSSISSSAEEAFLLQKSFVSALVKSLSAEDRARVAGLH
ncbi:exosortase-associated protein EpsI, B-type [Methylotenera mobilis]|uniref:EpsI family protein n=1 Tax=Methylotenera mobilis (strain JLW8 / ATCC BAA-1282 / DSM 17540) TaxID=583345 RepID=C6WXP7_METML|nr:exosortase-associated protein EpsI, B-type [Methylotenera mobilis]ACT48696.1 EpsI family protein [Methylotenera mobilis JLW8]